MRLFDVIDQEIAESLINQHDRFDVGMMTVAHWNKDFPLQGWYVYYAGIEVRLRLGEKPTPFPSLAEALQFALSPRTNERLGEWIAARHQKE